MNRSLSIDRLTFTIAIGFAVFVGLVPATDVAAQGCFEHISNHTYTPYNCQATPQIDRVFRLQSITWNGHDYLFVDEGNEITIMRIDSPLSPSQVTTSFFQIPNVGDSDYDLQNFSVCDDCRYGIANYKAATVLFDLGTGGTPGFHAVYKNFDANLVHGGFTFKTGGQQYLVAHSLGTSACSGSEAGLYEFNGIDEGDNPLLECIENGSGDGIKIANGIVFNNESPPVIYLSERLDRFNIFRFQSSGPGLSYLGNAGIERANMYRGYGIDVDETNGLMAVAQSGELKIFDIGYGSGSPASPNLRATKNLPSLSNANAVAISYPVVHVAQQYSTEEPLTFDISNPSQPTSLDQDFWDSSNPWNSLGSCMWNNQASFSDDGTALYLSRYSVFQVIDPTDCAGPVEPVARLTVEPETAFPGDLVTVTNTSLWGTRYATWITDGPDPHGSTVLAGSEDLTVGGTSAAYTLPADMANDAVFYAHVAVETDEYPYVQGGTLDQVETEQITIDRTPQATIEISPQAVITGDTITITANAQGHPGGDPSPFEWTVTDGSGDPLDPQPEGNPVQVELTEGGPWIVALRTNYEHEVSGGGDTYFHQTQITKDISSVSAAFDIQPSNPFHNEEITLESNSRVQAGGMLDFDWDVLEPGSSTIVNSLGSCDGVHGPNYDCVIQEETLEPGVYDFRLKLTNTQNQDESTALIPSFVIGNGDIQVDFTMSTTTPDIGQSVLFQIFGIPGDDEITRAEWTFGGTGCDGTNSYTWPDDGGIWADRAAFDYADSGSKTIRLTVTTANSGVHPQIIHTLTVQDIGSCDGGSCTYSISPTSRTFSSNGGTGTFSVITQSGCSWSASEFSGWVNIVSGSSGSGSGTVTYQVAANAGAARTTTISVTGGNTHTINQGAGIECTYTINPTQSSFPGLGGTTSVDITTDNSCDWNVSTPDSWIHLTSPTSGTGPGFLSFEVEENGTGPRNGVVLIADQIHTVLQDSLGPCEGGEVHDDGTVENGYGWGNGSVFTQLFTPETYPFVYTDVCAAFTQAGGDSTLAFDVLIFDDDGPGGGPGTLIGSVPTVVGGVPPLLDHTFATVAMQDTGVVIFDGSVYIGVGWDESTEVGFYVAADESSGTEAQTGFFSADGSTWESISSEFPDYRSLLVRADGFSPVDGEWEQVVGSIFGGGNGFGDTLTSRAESMASFNGALYVGTKHPFGGDVKYTTDGENWFPSSEWGFDEEANEEIATLIPFDGYLYASTSNPLFGTEIWRTTGPWAWLNVEDSGFGDPLNASAPSGTVFEGSLYLGTRHSGGCEIWKTPDGTIWGQIHTNGFGNSQNQGAESMAVFQNALHVGTSNVGGAELWKSPDGLVWFPVMTGGFGSSANESITDLVSFDGALYAGLSNSTTGAQLWRSINGTDWDQIVDDGFGDPSDTSFDALGIGDIGLHAAVSGPSSPATIWQSPEGTTWTQSSSPGFRNPENESIPALHYWGDRIFAGTANPSFGCEVWRGGRHPIFEDGFESGDISAWSATVP